MKRQTDMVTWPSTHIYFLSPAPVSFHAVLSCVRDLISSPFTVQVLKRRLIWGTIIFITNVACHTQNKAQAATSFGSTNNHLQLQHIRCHSHSEEEDVVLFERGEEYVVDL